MPFRYTITKIYFFFNISAIQVKIHALIIYLKTSFTEHTFLQLSFFYISTWSYKKKHINIKQLGKYNIKEQNQLQWYLFYIINKYLNNIYY